MRISPKRVAELAARLYRKFLTSTPVTRVLLIRRYMSPMALLLGLRRAGQHGCCVSQHTACAVQALSGVVGPADMYDAVHLPHVFLCGLEGLGYHFHRLRILYLKESPARGPLRRQETQTGGAVCHIRGELVYWLVVPCCSPSVRRRRADGICCRNPVANAHGGKSGRSRPATSVVLLHPIDLMCRATSPSARVVCQLPHDT